MKKLILLAACASLASCTTTPQTNPEQATLEANKALVIQLNDAQNAWDFETLASLMAPDIKRHCQATPTDTVESREDYLALLRSWQATLPDANQVINRIIAEGDMVAVHVTLTGTQTGPMGPLPPTGKPIVSNALAMFRIADGLVQELWVEWDNVAILTQLGVMPGPEDAAAAS